MTSLPRRPTGFRAAAALLALLLAATGSAADAPGGAQEARVDAVRWQGVEAVPERALEDAILTTADSWLPWRRDRPFSEADLMADMERIEELYRTRGYYGASASYTLEWSEDRSEVVVHVAVEEGEPVRLEAVRIGFAREGALSEAERQSVRAAAGLEAGTPLGARAYSEARRRVLERLAELGRPAARLRGGAEIRLVVRAARVDWRIDPGPEVHLGRPVFVGLDEVEPEVLRRELTFAPGDRYTPAALRSSRDALLELGLFRSVVLEPRRQAAPAEGEGDDEVAAAAEARGATRDRAVTWPVEVRVEERKLRTVRVGVGFGTEDLVRGQASWRNRNFLGGARTLELSAKASALLRGVDAHFLQPHVWQPELSFELDAAARRDTLPAYDADLVETGFLFRRPLGEHWSVRVGHGFDFVHVRDLPDGSERELEDLPEDSRLSFLRLGLRRVELDDRVAPRRGTWLDLSLEPAGRVLGSTVDYLKAVGEVRGYAPLPFAESVLAARLRLGTLEPLGGVPNDAIPVVKRFYSGGSTSVRGFELQGLGSLDEDDEPLGGLSLFEASLEWRVPLWRELGAVAFSDAGQVSLEPTSFSGKVFVSAGAGLRYGTPLGPLRLDVARVLNPDDGVGAFRVHVSVGHAF